MSFDQDSLLSRFDALFPDASPRFVVRAPGRLNVIGEHTDYNGLPVLPFAIDASIRIAFAPVDEPRVTLHALDFPETSPVSFKIEADIPPSEQGHWINYVKASVQDAAHAAQERGTDPLRMRGFVGVIAGDLPKNAGLSSSSALVVAAAMAIHTVQGWTIDPPELALRCADAEHYVGTRGGGMDQTTSLCGQSDACLKMYFYPLELEEVPVHVPCSFLVAHSRVEAAKSAGARHHYNQRVLECRIVTAMVRQEWFSDSALSRTPTTASESSPLHPLRYLGDLRKSCPIDRLDELRDRALSAIDRPEWSWGEIETRIGAKPLAALVKTGRFDELIENLPPHLPLQRRAKFLFEEWARVEQAATALAAGDLKELGRLLYEAHHGLTRDYEVSHPRVDALIKLAKDFGLPGARMTGAGFGGSTLHLVPHGQERDYTQFLARWFYSEPVDAVAGRFVHVFRPSAGADVKAV